MYVGVFTATPFFRPLVVKKKILHILMLFQNDLMHIQPHMQTVG